MIEKFSKVFRGIPGDTLADKTMFLSRHAGKLRALVGADILGSALAEAEFGVRQRDVVNRTLNAFSLKALTAELRQDGKHVVFAATDPGGFAALAPALKTAILDPRVGRVSMLLEDRAYLDFSALRESGQFSDVPKRLGQPLFSTILNIGQEQPVDALFINVASSGALEPTLLLNAKAMIGAKRLIVVHDAWSLRSETSALGAVGWADVDAVCVNDSIAERMLLSEAPFLAGRVHPIGTGQTDAVLNAAADRAAIRSRARAALGLSDSIPLFLLAGGVSGGSGPWPGAENEITIRETRRGFLAYAEKSSEELALVFAPHPRDPRKPELCELFDDKSVPAHIKLRTTAAVKMPFEEAAWAADVVASTWSTETFKAPYRGLHGAVLAFPGSGEDAIQSYYGLSLDALKRLMDAVPGVSVVQNPEQLGALTLRAAREGVQSGALLSPSAGRIVELAGL